MPTVLLIEANQMIREKVAAILKRARWNVITAPDGEKGVALAEAYQPHLIVCDVDAPLLNGYNVLVAVRAMARLADVPFIFTSAWADVEEISYALSLGANEFMLKTLSADRIMALVQRHMAV